MTNTAEPTESTVNAPKQWLPKDYVTATIATFALIVAIVTATISYNALSNQGEQVDQQAIQIALQSQQLSQQREQFESSGPVFESQAKVGIFNTQTSQWTLPIDYQLQDTVLSDSNNRVEMLADVTNTGRLSGAIQQVGIEGARSALVAPKTRVSCANPKSAELGPCEFPIVLEPQQTASFYIPLDDVVKQELSCHPEGLDATLDFSYLTVSKTVYIVPTPAKIYWTSLCNAATTTLPPSTTPESSAVAPAPAPATT